MRADCSGETINNRLNLTTRTGSFQRARYTLDENDKGDGVAERNKASFATCTDAGSNPVTGGIFLRTVTDHGVQRKRPASPTRARQIPTDAHLKILPNTKTCSSDRSLRPKILQ
ncbi:uncharacterized protein LOC115032986 [Acyrthosiphon pisum]|uniref:Uncharacterized protein n=1 Tax=Acyrthosiphon pisum TaxID=7029 RepID=A0A8R2JT00_ACYPI|nr:uncharacterized protein LOC115032986 [Acyrthosiphon pisum]|eukprot:XP_016660146.1 PREDICTED: uncharacterized protein LOC107883832 isoform X1 [Acyrthosiphon pisum]